ncbi:MAG: hypothetical protein HWN66_14545 [Candidatus Helarchaeota archaeon]|nr:hypothetical protein [Candidatus Helarchaeota archaeon]
MKNIFREGIIKTLVKFIAIFSGLVGIAGFAFFLWQKSLHYSIEFLLFTFSIILLMIVLRLRGMLTHLSSEYSMSQELHYEHLALTYFTSPDHLIEDDTHRFLLREEHFEIKGKDAFFNYRLRGHNASSSPSKFIRQKISDDSPIEVDRLGFEAIDNQSKMPLEWKVIKDQTYVKHIEIYFTCPLSPGDSFDISFSYKLYGSFTRKADYTFFPEHIYKKGTNKLIASLSLDYPPIRYEMLTFDGKKFITEEQPELVIEKNKVTIKWTKENPRNLYLLKFVRRTK